MAEDDSGPVIEALDFGFLAPVYADVEGESRSTLEDGSQSVQFGEDESRIGLSNILFRIFGRGSGMLEFFWRR
ncbi:MAG TPA: hypothetical protein VF068_02185 [Rubrobacter sp.]